MKMAKMTSKENPAKVGVKVNPATKASLEGVDDEAKLEILRRQMENMKPDDPDLPKMVMQRRQLEKECRRKHLKRELAELDEDGGDEYGGSMPMGY